MLQRVQTIFLGAVLISSVLLLFFPFQEINSGENKFQICLWPWGLKESVNPIIWWPFCLNIIILLGFNCILLFKKRSMQIKISTVIALLSIILFGSLFAFGFIDKDATLYSPHFKPLSFLPLLNSAWSVLARTFIMKDDNLVKSADRIR